jgi:hypothetical protein
MGARPVGCGGVSAALPPPGSQWIDWSNDHVIVLRHEPFTFLCLDSASPEDERAWFEFAPYDPSAYIGGLTPYAEPVKVPDFELFGEWSPSSGGYTANSLNYLIEGKYSDSNFFFRLGGKDGELFIEQIEQPEAA